MADKTIDVGAYGTWQGIVTQTSQDLDANTSRVRVRGVMKNTSGSSSYGSAWSWAISGQNSKSGSDGATISGGASYTLIDETFTVTHGSDGKKTVTYGIKLNPTGTYTFGDGGSVSVSLALTRIPQNPDPPTGLAASAVSPSSAKLTFSAPGDNGGASISKYTAQVDDNSGFSSPSLKDIDSGGTITGLATKTKYWVRVYATNSAGNSGYSNTISFTTTGVPSAPATPTTSSLSPTSVKLAWTAPANGGSTITGYTIQRATNSGFTTGVATLDTTATSATVTGLAERTAYWLRVQATNGIGDSSFSSAVAITTTGHPVAPTAVTPVASTTATGVVSLSWTAPSSAGTGGITGYNVFRNDVQIATITGTTTSYTDSGLTPFTTYTYNVAARNAYSDSVDGVGPQSADASIIAQGPPSAPLALSAISNGAVPGRVDLSWTAPTNTGTGGITGYRVRLSDGTLVVNQNGTGTTYSVVGLTPGSTYTFKVSGRNALSDAAGSEGTFSAAATAAPLGEPNAPTGLTVLPSATASNRLVVSWTAPAGTLSGYNVFSRVSGADTLIATVNSTHTSYEVDNLVAGNAYTYVVRARTVYTDTLTPGYPGNWGGPATSPVTGVPTVNSVQVAAASVTDNTNSDFSGSYVINQITANTLRYAKPASNVAAAATSGTLSNPTAAAFNGTYTIATPTTKTITYSKTAPDLLANGSSGGTITDTTNIGFNGTFTVTAVNAGANLLSFTNAGANVTTVAVPPNPAPGAFGTIVNLSNAVFNGTGKTITAADQYTFSYAQTNANVAESNASGTVTDTTNRDVFNGDYTAETIPAYNQVTYTKTASNVPLRTWVTPNGVVYRTVSPSVLNVQFRSGWSG